MNKELLIKTFRNTSGAAIYIFAVSQVMQNGEKLFGKEDNMLAPFAVLLLFSLSAAVVGGLVFGQSILLFLSNKKIDGIKAAIYSIGWLGIYTMIGFLILLFAR
ncbi:MAG TPA: hypothetical protein PK263_06145 [bacterium]|nr:hypothetical protein [bacterium]